MVGRTIKIRSGPLKGYRGRVKEVTGVFVRVELDSQMKVVTGNHPHTCTEAQRKIILDIMY